MSKQMDDIVFEGRNKDYGAYVLRSKYPKNLKRAIFIAFGCFILLSLSPKIKRIFFDSEEDKPIEYYRQCEYVLIQPPSSGDKPNIILKSKQAQASSSSEEKEIKATNKEEAEKEKKNKDDKNAQNKTDKDSSNSSSDPNGKKDGDPIYTNVDRSPYFIGGEDAFFEFLKTNTQYPEAEKTNSDEGICGLSFVVTIDGQVEKIKVVRSSGFKSFDEEAIRVIQLCNNKFNAAIKAGKPVKSICRIDITFNLD